MHEFGMYAKKVDKFVKSLDLEKGAVEIDIAAIDRAAEYLFGYIDCMTKYSIVVQHAPRKIQPCGWSCSHPQR